MCFALSRPAMVAAYGDEKAGAAIALNPTTSCDTTHPA